eukprot:GSMAST32.ASY1.ANO1.269.1 assembled CDS
MSFSHRPSHRSNQVSDRKLRTSGLKEMMEGLRPTNHVPEIVEFLHIGDYSDSKKSSVLINKPLFRPEPSQIVFEQYEPFQTYQSILYMRNNDNVPRRIKISFPDSPFFQVSAPRPAQKGQKLDKGGKVAAGMELCFTITFKPQSKVAYTYDLICVTEREKFIVPIICVGTRPCLDFPDEFRFDIGPVKFAQTKSFVARNVGQLADRFKLQTSPPFSVHCESVQVSVTFTPPDASDYEEELMITYESNPDVKIYMKLVGGANSYISLQAHSTLRIQNRTDVPVKFEWKSFGNHRDEVEERRRLEAEIIFDADDDSDALSDDEALTRKYKNLRKQLADDPLLFANDNFSIEPMTSEIWANSDLEVTINFLPSNAASYQTVAFLDITGRDNRLPVKLCGVGIGPKAAFSFDVLDVGDIFLGSVHNYQLELINRGDIAASWSLQVPDSPFDQNFSFEPKRGELATGETAEINVTFSSNILGEFSEHYIFALQGSQQTLSVHFKGHVVGPTFHFDTDSIKFGRISYEFLNSKVLSLFNTSEIPMTFNLRVPQDGKNLDKEFDILPSSGTIQPGDRKKIQIDFISNTVKVYNYFLTVDVEGVGDALLSLPITASCGVPNVILEKEEIPYGTSYLRYKYEKSITLTNKSKDLRARYEVLPQDKHSVAIAKYFAMHNKGVIEAGETLEVPLYLVCQKLGKIKMPIYIRISGSENPPLVPMVFALGVGPIITSNISEMKWGNVPCLKDAEKTLVLRNTCPIVAPFQAYIENARSKFRVNVGKGQLQPGQNVKLTVTALLDDIVNTSDELIIAVSEGDALTIPLLARGVGTTMHCDEALEVVDFSHQFTNNECKRRFLLENKGRRPQMLTWKSKTNKKQIDINSIVPCFTISPDQIELKPRTACYFTFIGKSLEAGPVEEMLRLESKVGKDQTIHKVFNTCFKANFIDPLLEMVENLDFSYTFSPSVPLSTQSKAITLKNVSSLELKFVLRTQPPFKVDVYEVELEPGSSTTVNVEFNPGYKSDRLSRKVEGKITVVYRDHPQKDSIAVNGEINFPNLDFDFSQINFGCILNDTTKSMTMTISNNSKIDTTYSWAFFENESDCRAVSTSRKPYIPINQVFDILPIRSFLKPGQSEKIEFVMYGHTNRSFKGKCVCEVEGGPDYDMDLIGEASSVSYKVDKLELDFGDLLHNRAEELEFNISNTGKVPFSFRVSTDLISRPGIVEVIPTSGRIFGKDKAKVVVRFCPVLPETIDEKLVLEVAHFEPVEIPVRGIGVYSSVSLSLPQTITEEWTDLMESAREYLLAAEESLSENSENLSETKRYKNENESTDQKNGDGPTDETTKPEDTVVAETSEATEIDTKNKTETDEIQLDTKETEIVESNEGGNEKIKPPQALMLVDVEREARRIQYLQHLQDQLEKNFSSIMTKQQNESVANQLFEDKKDDDDDQLSVPYVIAEHYADFGNVITGSSRKKTFRITNRGKVPVSFCINNRKGSCGFTVEPEKVNRLPEGMSVDFTIKFKARKKLGPVEIEVPIEVKGGPSVMLSLRAIVTIPDLVIRPNVIDFRKVLVGHCKEIYVTLFNPAPVPTEWVLKIPTSGPMTKASSRFKLIPASGTLAPGQKEQVMIVFTPSSEQTYLYKMSFQLNSNKKRKTLTCKGIGKEFKFKFFPRMLKMEPMKPFEPPRDTIVTARNDCDYPVEFYSLDFDTQYKDEENMLISKGEFDEHGTLFIEPRQPGKQLELENVINIYDDADDTETNILIVGAPCSGKTSLAKHLSEKHGLTYMSLSNLLETARNTQTSSWQFIKAALDAAEILAGIVIDGLLFTLSSSQEGSEYPNLRTAAGIPVEEDLPLASKVSLASSLVTLFGPSEYGGLSTVACQATNEVLEARLEEILLKISGTSVDNNIEPTEDGANVEINAEVKVEHSDVSPNEPSPEQIALKARVDRVKTSGALALYEKDRTTIESLLGSSKENVADGGTESNANSNSNTSNTLNFIHIDINQSQEECATNTSEQLGLKDAPEDDGFDPVPFPRDLQIIQKPSGRLKRPHVKNFCVMPFPEGDLDDKIYPLIIENDNSKTQTTDNTENGDTPKDAEADDENENETDEKSTELLIKNNNPTRWVIPPNSELKLQIRFGAGRTGKYDTTLGFEISAPPERVSRKFVISRNCYEFGPLLAGKDIEACIVKGAAESGSGKRPGRNAEFFRVSNNSMFSAKVNGEEEDVSCPFVVDPKELELPVGETKDIVVWAFPQKCHTYKDTLICCVDDNHTPVTFDVSCIGTTREEALLKGPPLLDFDRLLLDRREFRKFVVKNVCTISVAWKLDLRAFEEHPEFEITPTSGILRPRDSTIVSVSFSAIEEKFIDDPLNIKVIYSDNEGGLNIENEENSENTPYKISTNFKLEDEEGNALQTLDFGANCFRRNSTKSVFSIDPMSIVVKPGTDEDINVTFLSKREVRFFDCKDILCKSVFSKFRLQPMRGINFGALKFGNSSSRKFELRNDGVFPFRYKVIQWENKVPEPIPIAVDGENVLKCGQFTIEPACGTIMPNGIVLFEASFTAEGSQVFNEEFLIDTSNRDPSVGIEALRYNMSGESCVPALENKNFESIFEEQEVMRSIGPNDTLRRAFAEEDNTFTFGAIVPQMNPEGAKERFKITNPSKVRAIIRFSTTSTDDKEDNIFSVQPEMEEIPPHEHRYITVYFKPKKIQHYSATFKALVDDSEYNAENGLLEVQLTGQGTMPCITIMDPMTRSANGRVLLDFNKLQIGKSRTRSITVRNDGIVPCTVRLSVSGKSKQMFALKNSISSTLTLGTKAEEKVDLVFAPTANQDTPFAASLNVDVMSNKFDSEVVDLLGSSFAEDISFRNLPEKKEDELIFGEQDMDLETEGIQQSFTIVNHQSKPVKFEWANHRDFSFLPISGHLSAHGSKEIIGTFSCQAEENKVMYEKEDIALTINSIQYNGSTVPETVWDSSQIAVTFDEEGKEVTNAIAEPEHEIIGEAKVVMLACTARADKVGYECDCPKSISFRDTLMFQKRNYKFVLKNPTQTVLKFDWQLDDETNVTGGITAPNPFEFEPSNGSIMPGDSQTICLSFKPIEADVFRYNCLCAMEGLSKDYKPLNITVIGRAQRPVCHFEISQSHYLAIDSLGTNVRNTKRFYVTNPMDSNYEFSWEPVGGATSMFRCIAAQGLVLSGKRFEMAFEYTPINVGTHESFWRFSIPQRNVSTIFLLVGKVGEPRVRFDMPSINFKHVLLRSRSTETLNIINDEHIPFAYSFDLSQFEGRDEKPAIRIQPARGVVPPNGKTPIQIMFVPTNEKHSNFNLSCSIKNKPTQLSVNVKGQGYAVHDRATLITSQNQSGNELSRRGINYVDFGDVTMNAIQTKDIVLTNTGEFNFEFSWSRLKHPMLTIEPAFGTVRKGARVPCKLTFNPKTECSLKHIKLTCTVAGSSSYVLQIDGRGTKAAVHFSQTEFDFGPIFVAPPGSGAVIQTRTETLRIVNNEMDSDMTIDCLYEKKPHLDVQCDTQVLSPHQSMEVPIIFTPKECKSYTEAVVFEINSLYTVNCIVRAEGTSMRLELADPSMRHIAFGSPTPGNDVERQIRIVNRSKVATKFELLEPNGKDGVGLLTSKNISFYPFGTQTLKPRESCAVELRFSPIGSMPPFNEVLQMRQEDGRTLTLCTVAGACLGVDARLDTECLPFGAVCSQSFIKRKVVLQNSGDVGTKYRWNSLFKPHFSIEPKEGYLDSHSQVIFEITFHPQKVSDDIRNESPQIMLEGSQPIGLTLTGSCVPQPEQEELNFESRVRETQVKTVTISNPTKMEWNLCAAFENEYWSGLDVLTIPAGSEGQYEVKYTPLTMTPNVAGAVDDDAKHNGLLFFALPNGKTASWKLIGVSTKPVVDELPEGTRLSTPCKETLIIALPVRNWLKEAQKFTVEIKVADEDEKEATFLRGAQTVVLPAMAKRQYKLSYTPWTVSDTRTTVTFRNEKTGEYFFYEFTLRSLSSEEANFILRLGSICRVPTTQLITVENPLPPTTVVNLPEDFWTCDDSNVRVKAVGELSGRPEGTFEVEYRPLVVGVKQATLMLNLGSVLGSFKYDLELIATEGAAESSLHFNVPLGESSKKIFRFKSFCPEAARYSCSVTDPLFFEVVDGVDVAAATSWNGIEGTVEVNFEPERLGSIQDKLIVKSPTGGEFMCLLNGECTPPLPRGPVDMKPGGSDSVVFKNVFNEEHTFTFSVDNDAFSVDVSEQKIPRHTEATVKVSQAVGTPADACGKLLITCSEIAGLPPWVVYIGGKN